MKPSVDGFYFPWRRCEWGEEKGNKIHTCPDVLPAQSFGLEGDVHFCRRDHLEQLIEQGNVYVLVYEEAVEEK